jgi:hypothetical protein
MKNRSYLFKEIEEKKFNKLLIYLLNLIQALLLVQFDQVVEHQLMLNHILLMEQN